MLGELEKRAARGADADRRRGALDRGRGRRPVPRRARRGAARRAAGGLPRGRWRSRSRGSPAATRAPTGRSPPRELSRAATGSTWRRCCATSSAPATSCTASCAPAAPSASGATPRCCAACAAPRSRPCARRSSPPSSARWRASCRRGRASTAPPRRRRRGPAARGARAASGRGARAGGVGARRAAAPRRRLLADVDRPALRGRRARLGRRGRARAALGPGRALLPRGRPLARPAAVQGRAAGRAAARRASARGSPPAPRSGPTCSPTSREAEPVELQEALWDLVWAGEVTNDAFAPLRAPRLTLARASERRRSAAARFARRRRPAAPQVQGRWSLDRAAVRRRARLRPADARAGRGAARALRDRHARDRAGRGHPGRLRRPVRRARQPGDARHRAPRLLRGGARRRPVRAPGRDRAAARDAHRRAGRRRWCWPRPTRPTRSAPRCPGPSATTTRTAARRACRAPTWSRSTPSRCSTSSAAARACCRSRPGGGWLRPAFEALAEAVRRARRAAARHRALRRRAGGRLGDGRAADRARLPAVAAAADPERVSDLNRTWWDERVPLHVASDFYDVEAFKAGANTLRPFELEEVGDVSGRSLVHLQCHFGLDSLSWARLGARVTGLDFSEPAIEAARMVAAAAELDAEPMRLVDAPRRRGALRPGLHRPARRPHAPRGRRSCDARAGQAAAAHATATPRAASRDSRQADTDAAASACAGGQRGVARRPRSPAASDARRRLACVRTRSCARRTAARRLRALPGRHARGRHDPERRKRVGAALVGSADRARSRRRSRASRWTAGPSGSTAARARGRRARQAPVPPLRRRPDAPLAPAHGRLVGRLPPRRALAPQPAPRLARASAPPEHEVVQFDGPVLELMTDGAQPLRPADRAARPRRARRRVRRARRSCARLREDDPTRGIGDALLDQRNVAGIGNIWKSEGCFIAGLDPWRRLRDVSDDEALGGRARAMRPPMQASAARGGRRAARDAWVLRPRGTALPPLRHARSASAARATTTARATGARSARR